MNSNKTNTGRKDHMGRTIWRGPRGGEFVIHGGNRVARRTGFRSDVTLTVESQKLPRPIRFKVPGTLPAYELFGLVQAKIGLRMQLVGLLRAHPTADITHSTAAVGDLFPARKGLVIAHVRGRGY